MTTVQQLTMLMDMVGMLNKETTGFSYLLDDVETTSNENRSTENVDWTWWDRHMPMSCADER